jgi:LysM repeat protein
MSDVDLPGVGNVKRQWLYVGGAGLAGILGYAYWRRRGQVAAPAAIDPNSIPATDYTNPETYTGGNSTGTYDTTGGTVISTNDQWTNKALSVLSDSGFESQFVVTTLGKWLARQPLTPAEIDLVQAAKAAAGDPPVGGPYPIVHATPDSGGVPTTPGGLPLPATQTTTSHTVVAGETLESIVAAWTKSNNGGITPSAQQVADNMRTVDSYNQLHGRQVHPGDVIVLPAFPRGYY